MPLNQMGRVHIYKSRLRAKARWPFGKENYFLFGLSLVIIIISYVLMTMEPWDSIPSLTLAPILLVIGYCITLPIAILHKKRNKS